jgi:hypothetical protein
MSIAREIKTPVHMPLYMRAWSQKHEIVTAFANLEPQIVPIVGELEIFRLNMKEVIGLPVRCRVHNRMGDSDEERIILPEFIDDVLRALTEEWSECDSQSEKEDVLQRIGVRMLRYNVRNLRLVA